VNIYRIRYFLGLVGFTLRNLNDNGTYLQIFGLSFPISVVFAPVVHKMLSMLSSQYSHLRCINASILAFFVTWMIPDLRVQIVTFSLFIVARLFTFSVLTAYGATEFSVEHFRLVTGAGYLAAAIPEAFTCKIVDVVLDKYHGNFWIFHLICMCVSIPVALITWYFQRKSEWQAMDFNELPSNSSNDRSNLSMQNDPYIVEIR